LNPPRDGAAVEVPNAGADVAALEAGAVFGKLKPVLEGVVVLAVLVWPKPVKPPLLGAAAPPNPVAIELAGVAGDWPKLKPVLVAGAAAVAPNPVAGAAVFPNENELAAGVEVAGAALAPNEKPELEAPAFGVVPNDGVVVVAIEKAEFLVLIRIDRIYDGGWLFGRLDPAILSYHWIQRNRMRVSADYQNLTR